MEDIISLAELMLSGDRALSMVHQVSDRKTGLTLPSDLVTMERVHDDDTNRKYNIIIATERIATIVFELQVQKSWAHDWKLLGIYFRDHDTRVAAGHKFQTMFFRKFKNLNPNTMPPCYELVKNEGKHSQSPLADDAIAAMPWTGLGEQPKLDRVSVGKDAGGLYAPKEFEKLMDELMDINKGPIRFVIPRHENWASWDAAVFLRTKVTKPKKKRGKKGKKGNSGVQKTEVDIVFLQLTTQEDHKIVAKGLNQVRDVMPKNESLTIRYHFVIVLLIESEPESQIPKWRRVLVSNGGEADKTWNENNLRQYIMYVPMKELLTKD